MADQPQPSAISAAFPAPPPFYKSFTSENLERQKEFLASNPEISSNLSSPSALDLLSLPPELRNLFPPPLPPNGKYRSFGVEHDLSSTSATESRIYPTPARLQALTQKLLLSFLSLTNVLATNPRGYAPIWEDLHASFKEVHEVINGYRPHQARETLILMMQEQVDKVRAETKAVQESVERAQEVLKGLGRERGVEGQMGTLDEDEAHAEKKRKKRREAADKKVWEILEREVGRL